VGESRSRANLLEAVVPGSVRVHVYVQIHHATPAHLAERGLSLRKAERSSRAAEATRCWLSSMSTLMSGSGNAGGTPGRAALSPPPATALPGLLKLSSSTEAAGSRSKHRSWQPLAECWVRSKPAALEGLIDATAAVAGSPMQSSGGPGRKEESPSCFARRACGSACSATDPQGPIGAGDETSIDDPA
jgi:hypothetical protein